MRHVTVMMEMADINLLSYKEAPAITRKALTRAKYYKYKEEEKKSTFLTIIKLSKERQLLD